MGSLLLGASALVCREEDRLAAELPQVNQLKTRAAVFSIRIAIRQAVLKSTLPFLAAITTQHLSKLLMKKMDDRRFISARLILWL